MGGMIALYHLKNQSGKGGEVGGGDPPPTTHPTTTHFRGCGGGGGWDGALSSGGSRWGRCLSSL